MSGPYSWDIDGVEPRSGVQIPGGRLSALDGSFLRLESPSAHMHVGWSAVFAAPDDSDRPTLAALRERVASRLETIDWCRWKLKEGAFGLTDPRWVHDPGFDLAAHVTAVGEPDEPMTYGGFAKLRDSLLSRPLDRSRPMWQMVLVPRLEDGGVGLLGKIHHSLVDGMAALQIVGLVVDQPSAPVLTHRTGATVAVPAMLRPITVARGLVSDAWRTLMAARQDVLPPAPKSGLNVPIGPRRTLAGYHATRADLTAARAAGGTLNDTGLTIVAGAIRALATRRGETPAKPLKAMVPVNMRAPGELGPGNRIAMVYIQLPVHLRSPHERLQWVRDQTAELKDNRRATNMQTLYAAGGLLPAPLRSPVARALSSPLVFNLTISQSPGPRGQLHMLGCELQEVYSVVPIPAGHVLAIGMIRYRKELFIGCYADPDALPEVHLLPSLLDAELQALAAIRHRVVSR